MREEQRERDSEVEGMSQGRKWQGILTVEDRAS